ncbi:S-layer homology domain-containing protein [Sporosarcina sp. E16_3]|uniref:S-layer homology domain-containing protein n=1 Tax=Sporosarcina sp. E16_3 TaxID=2789293 RepID=UPI001A920A26|nr:S-layer homology domain-containing protein [Sporosarcina sp. E16_3]MBO0603389.1 S-layer homology domain-containing protein [Sporosarcina sp. E16_3]
MKRKIMTALGALLLACSLPLSSSAADKQLFKDVPPTKHFAESVNELAERNVIGGYPDGTFKPSNSITRGQAAAIIAKMIKLDTDNVKNPNFKDVSTANGYYKAIAAMAEKGIIGGYADGRYGPNDPIKRGQMASILVKAFDLPRDGDIGNPFKDVPGYGSHDDNILIIYKLGITTGTTPSTFSPNAAITRGQAAKMITATEDAKPSNLVTLEPSDFGWDLITNITADEINSGLFKAVLIKGKEGYTENKVQLIPLKEGLGAIVFHGRTSRTAELEHRKNYVHIKKENGELKLTLEKMEDHLPTVAELYMLYGEFGPRTDVSGDVRNVSLATMDGKMLNDNMTFKVCDYSICIDIDKPGEYIATVRFADGKVVLYGIESKVAENKIYYTMRTLKEQPTFSYGEEDKYDIGKYNIWPENYEQIADVTREPGTNRFHYTGKKAGTVIIDYVNKIDKGVSCEGPNNTGDCHRHLMTGIGVSVEQIGSIIHVSGRGLMEPDL